MRPDEHVHATRWVKSSASTANGQCLEAAGLREGHVAIRNSKDPGGPVVRFTRDEWQAFLIGVKAGEFDTLA